MLPFKLYTQSCQKMCNEQTKQTSTVLRACKEITKNLMYTYPRRPKSILAVDDDVRNLPPRCRCLMKISCRRLLPLAGLVLADLLWYHRVDNALKVGKLLSDHSLVAGRSDDSRRQLITCQLLGSAVVLRSVASQRSKVDPNENVFQVGLSTHGLNIDLAYFSCTCNLLIFDKFSPMIYSCCDIEKMACHIQDMFASSRLKIFFGFTLFK